MEFKALLNTDMSVVLHGLGRLWRWWVGELRSTIPILRHVERLPKSRLVAELRGDEVVFREYRRAAALPIPRYGVPKKMLAESVFALPEQAVLVRDLQYPPLPTSDLRRMTTLEFDRLTPFRSEDVIFDIEVQSDGKPVALGVVRKRTLNRIMEHFWALGAEPKAISLVDRTDGVPRFDFLPWTTTRRPLLGLKPAQWWLVVAVLFAANIALLIAKDVYSLSSLREEVQLQRSSVHLASALRRRVSLEEERRATLVQSRRRPSPLAVWNAVTTNLPDDAWVEHLEWNGKIVRLVGTAPQGFDVLKAVSAAPAIRGLPEPSPGIGRRLPEAITKNAPEMPPKSVAGGSAVAKKHFDVAIILKERP